MTLERLSEIVRLLIFSRTLTNYMCTSLLLSWSVMIDSDGLIG
jgi:hypothetical protein